MVTLGAEDILWQRICGKFAVASGIAVNTMFAAKIGESRPQVSASRYAGEICSC